MKLVKNEDTNGEAMERVQMARHDRRPYAQDFISRIFTDFYEIHGDRKFRDDPAIVCGAANSQPRPVVVVAHRKGRDVRERQIMDFGMSKPDGYRKALRVRKMA